MTRARKRSLSIESLSTFAALSLLCLLESSCATPTASTRARPYTPGPPAELAANATPQDTSTRAPEVLKGTCDPALAEALDMMAKGMLRVESHRRVHLASEPWPSADYCIVRLTPSTTGQLTLAYRFERLRPREASAEVVERTFAIDVLPSGPARTLTLDFPYRFPIRLGDSVEIPVPLGDPWGELRSFGWLPAQQQASTSALWLPDSCAHGAAPAGQSTGGPQLQHERYGCVRHLLANLQTRTDRWESLRAATPGPVLGTELEVVPSSERVVQRVRIWQERSLWRSSSSMTQVDKHAVVQLRVGDAVWMRATPP